MGRASHGMIPNPAPAVVELLASVRAPTRGLDLGVELTTPTGAALLAALAVGFGPLPPMTVERSGFGAGTREIDGRPNATQVVIGTSVAALGTGQPVVLRSEEHTSELQSLMRISYAVFCLKNKNT